LLEAVERRAHIGSAGAQVKRWTVKSGALAQRAADFPLFNQVYIDFRYYRLTICPSQLIEYR
jgi:hypothetical protein